MEGTSLARKGGSAVSVSQERLAVSFPFPILTHRRCDVYQTYREQGDEWTNAYNPQILVGIGTGGA